MNTHTTIDVSDRELDLLLRALDSYAAADGTPCPDGPAGHCHAELLGARPGRAERGNFATSPPDHSGRVASVAGRDGDVQAED